jgi:hypothetical protein
MDGELTSKTRAGRRSGVIPYSFKKNEADSVKKEMVAQKEMVAGLDGYPKLLIV